MTTSMNTCSLLVAVAVAVATAVVCTFAPSPATAYTDPTVYPCPWRTVTYPALPFIQKLGKWALDQQHLTMRFDKVENARWQGVGGRCQCPTMFYRNYYYELIIDASLRDDNRQFRAVVYVTNFTQPKKVIFFSLFSDITPAPSPAPVVP